MKITLSVSFEKRIFIVGEQLSVMSRLQKSKKKDYPDILLFGGSPFCNSGVLLHLILTIYLHEFKIHLHSEG